MTCDIPIDIKDDENIVRLIRAPQHINKRNELRPAAFRSQAGTDDVSVVRHRHVGTDFCKAKAKELMKESYIGLAAVTAENIRLSTSSVVDTREEYCGHASVMHGMITPLDEPPESETNMLITERCRSIVKKTTLHLDPNPESDNWTGVVI